MPTLSLLPAVDGYSFTEGDEIRRVKTISGTRRRRDTLDRPHTANVTWVLSPLQYSYLRAFVRTEIDGGANQFDIQLIFDDSSLQTYTVAFDTLPALVRQEGNVYTVSAVLEVARLTDGFDTDYDEGFILLYNAFGEAILDAINNVDEAVNTNWPS